MKKIEEVQIGDSVMRVTTGVAARVAQVAEVNGRQIKTKDGPVLEIWSRPTGKPWGRPASDQSYIRPLTDAEEDQLFPTRHTAKYRKTKELGVWDLEIDGDVVGTIAKTGTHLDDYPWDWYFNDKYTAKAKDTMIGKRYSTTGGGDSRESCRGQMIANLNMNWQLFDFSTDDKTVKPKERPAKVQKNRYGLCYCGCGAKAQSRFLPGHDAKLKSQLSKIMKEQSSASGELSSNVLEELPTLFLGKYAVKDDRITLA